MTPNQALWEKGDFTKISEHMRAAGEAIALTLPLAQGMRVLDLGCGDGTTAVPMARRGADVTGIDIARNLVDAGNRRAREAGLDQLRFQQGDARCLEGVADRSFDLTVSIFGAMFAPEPMRVAAEMVRVTKPGGRIVMGNWIPNDPTFVSQVLKVSSAFTPPPPEGFVSPMTWGVEATVIERFGAAGIPEDRIALAKDSFRFQAPGLSPLQWIDLFRRYYGPTMNAFEGAEKAGKVEELYGQLVRVAEEQNHGSADGISMAASFLRVTVSV